MFYLFIHLSIYISVYLSIYLSIYLKKNGEYGSTDSIEAIFKVYVQFAI